MANNSHLMATSETQTTLTKNQKLGHKLKNKNTEVSLDSTFNLIFTLNTVKKGQKFFKKGHFVNDEVAKSSLSHILITNQNCT